MDTRLVLILTGFPAIVAPDKWIVVAKNMGSSMSVTNTVVTTWTSLLHAWEGFGSSFQILIARHATERAAERIEFLIRAGKSEPK